jgi:hypothetical protein
VKRRAEWERAGRTGRVCAAVFQEGEDGSTCASQDCCKAAIAEGNPSSFQSHQLDPFADGRGIHRADRRDPLPSAPAPSKMTARLLRVCRYLRHIVEFALRRGPGPTGFARRLSLGIRVLHVYLSLREQAATTFQEQLLLLSAAVELDENVAGELAEFGCYKGASSVVLSIAAKATGRKLLIFDSFEGLPEPTETVRNVATGAVLDYTKGMYAGSM